MTGLSYSINAPNWMCINSPTYRKYCGRSTSAMYGSRGSVGGKAAIPVIVRDPDGQTQVRESIGQAAADIGVGSSTLSAALRNHGIYSTPEGYVVWMAD